MADDWEDWENEDFSIPNLTVPTLEQIKKLEERKLVEESDNKIAKELFGFKDDNEEEEKNNINIDISFKPIRNKKTTVSKQKENEDKMKERAKKIREEKSKKIAQKELFGEAEEDEYDDYADKFYD